MKTPENLLGTPETSLRQVSDRLSARKLSCKDQEVEYHSGTSEAKRCWTRVPARFGDSRLAYTKTGLAQNVRGLIKSLIGSVSHGLSRDRSQ
jgi:hypothetical protein